MSSSEMNDDDNVFERLYNQSTSASRGQRAHKYESPYNDTTEWKRPTARLSSPKHLPSIFQNSNKDDNAMIAAVTPKKHPFLHATPSKTKQQHYVKTPSTTTRKQPPSRLPPRSTTKKRAPAATASTVPQIKVPPHEECMKLFDRFDYNGNGILSLAELDKAVMELWPTLNNKPAVMRAYKASDVDNNEFIKRDEFPFFLHYISYYNNLWNLFASTDTDGDRRITREEFMQAAPKLKLDKDPGTFFNEMDANGGGVVLFDEFCAKMAKQKSVSSSGKAAATSRKEDTAAAKPANAKTKPVAKAVTPKKKPSVSEGSKTTIDDGGKAKSEPVPQSAKPKAKKPEPAIPEAAMKVEVPPHEECMRVFDRIDYNGNGILSLAELDKAVVELWPNFDNKPAIMRAYKASDVDGNGFIKRDEFAFFLRYISYYNNLWDLFEATDEDGDRRLSKEEFLKVAPQLEITENAEDFFDEMDTNKGGMVLFDEFCAKMAAQSTVPSGKDIQSSESKEKTLPKTNGAPKPIAPEAAPIPEAAMQVTVPPHEDCMKVFEQIDYNGNGILSLAELDKAVVEVWPAFNNKPAIMRAYKASDVDNNGFIKRNEFPFFLRFISYYNNLWHVFALTDVDGDRRLTKEEFVKAAPKLGIENPSDFFDEMDANKGGIVLFDEFCAKMASQSDIPSEEQLSNSKQQPDDESHLSKTANSFQENVDPIPEAVLQVKVPPEAECERVFDQIDYNGNGILSLAELDKAVVEIWPEFNNKPSIMRAYKASDRDNNGFIRRNEFGFFLRYIAYYNNLWEVFSLTDADGDRRISKKEFIKAAPQLDIENPDEFFDQMDVNHGGYVLFDEFCTRMAMGPDQISPEEDYSDNGMINDFSYLEVPPEKSCLAIFDSIDTEEKGALSEADLITALSEIWPDFDNQPVFARAFSASDDDKDELVKRTKFLFFLRYMAHYQNLWHLFEYTDEGHDSRVTKEEFLVFAPKLNIWTKADEFFDEMDQDKDGYVLFHEICSQMAKKNIILKPSAKDTKPGSGRLRKQRSSKGKSSKSLS